MNLTSLDIDELIKLVQAEIEAYGEQENKSIEDQQQYDYLYELLEKLKGME